MKKFLRNLTYGIGILVIGFCFLGILNHIQPTVAKAAKETNISKEDSYMYTYDIGLMSTPAYIRFDGEDAGDYYVTVEDPSICELDKPFGDQYSQAIKMKGLKYGTTKLKVYKKENGTSVLKETRAIEVKKSEVRSFDITTGMNQSTNILLSVIKYPSSLESYTVTSSNPNAVVVRTSGNASDESSIPVICREYDQSELYTKKVGSSTITVEVKKGSKKSILGKLEVSVEEPSISESKIVYTDGYIGELIKNKNGSCTYDYTSSNESVVSVDDRGNCKVIKGGTTKITIKETNGNTTRTLGTVDITVLEPFPGGGEVKLDRSSKEEIGRYSEEFIPVTYINMKHDEIDKVKITAVSKNPKIVTIKDNRVIYPIKMGTAEILVKATYKGVTKTLGTIKVKVVNKVASLDTKEISIEKSKQKNADISYRNRDAKYTYISSNSKIVRTVKLKSGNGYFEGIKNGTATVTVKETLKGKTRTLGKIKVTVN